MFLYGAAHVVVLPTSAWVSLSNISSGRLEWRSSGKASLSLSKAEKAVSIERYIPSTEAGTANNTTAYTVGGFRLPQRMPYCDNPIANDRSEEHTSELQSRL